MTRPALIAAALVGVLACGSPTPPPRPAPKPAPAATPAVPAAAATAAAAPAEKADWVYSSAGKRDPFRSFLAEFSAQANSLVTRCATPLGRYEVDQLKLVAIITGLEDPVAMVQAPSGVGYVLRRGACLGKNGGVVTVVRTGEVVISESVIRADGSRDTTQTVIRLPKEAALTLEE